MGSGMRRCLPFWRSAGPVHNTRRRTAPARRSTPERPCSGGLGIDRVDILYIHDPDTAYEQAVEGAYRALERLRGGGTIAAIGVGMNQAEMLARFARDTDVDCFSSPAATRCSTRLR
jgi:diketogulonate reductase-like aldo/keto reductase